MSWWKKQETSNGALVVGLAVYAFIGFLVSQWGIAEAHLNNVYADVTAPVVERLGALVGGMF